MDDQLRDPLGSPKTSAWKHSPTSRRFIADCYPLYICTDGLIPSARISPPTKAAFLLPFVCR